MEKQIHLVKGGKSRVSRAARVRWKARSQRDKWMDNDVAVAATLHKFDRKLIERWGDLHYPLCEDFAGDADDTLCQKGREMLDWSHHKASTEIPPPRPDWAEPFLVQGSYQQLADELRVGWHPEFMNRLSTTENDEA